MEYSCVYFSYFGGWADNNCSTEQRFICAGRKIIDLDKQITKWFTLIMTILKRLVELFVVFPFSNDKLFNNY